MSSDSEEKSKTEVHSANSWETADLGDKSRNEKFLRLMGASKKEHHGRFIIGDQDAGHTRTRNEEKNVEEELAQQYQHSMEHRLAGGRKGHIGLGFHEAEAKPEGEEEDKSKVEGESEKGEEEKGDIKDSSRQDTDAKDDKEETEKDDKDDKEETEKDDKDDKEETEKDDKDRKRQSTDLREPNEDGDNKKMKFVKSSS